MSTIKTMAEFKAAIAEKRVVYDFAPGTTFVFDEYLVIEVNRNLNTSNYVLNGNGCTFDFSNVDRGIKIGGEYIVKDITFYSKGTRKMFDETKPELESPHFSRFAVKSQNATITNCTFNIRDKLGLELLGVANATSNVFLSGDIFVEGNGTVISNNRIENSSIVLSGNGCFLTNNSMMSTKIYLLGNRPYIDSNDMNSCRIYTSCYNKNSQGSMPSEILISNNSLDMTQINIREGDLKNSLIGVEIKNNRGFGYMIKIEPGGKDSTGNHGLFYVPTPVVATPQSEGKTISIIGNTGNGFANISCGLGTLDVRNNELVNFGIEQGKVFKKISIVGNKGLNFSSQVISGATLTLKLNNKVEELYIKDNEIKFGKAASNSMIDTSGCDVSIITNNELYEVNYPLLESNGKINIVKDNIIHSDLEKPIGLEDSANPKDHLLHNIIIKK